MPFIFLVFKNVIRRPLRTGLAVSGVALAVASFIALVGLARGHARAWEHSLMEQGTDILVARKGAVEIMSTSIEESVGVQLSRLPGVRDVAGELIDLVGLDSGQSVVISGRPTSSYLWTSLQMVNGTLPGENTGPAEGSGSGVALGHGVAQALGTKVGDHVSAEGHELTVTGVVRAGGSLTGHMLYMPLSEMQRLLHRLDVVTVFNLRLTTPDDRAAVQTFLQSASSAFPDLTFTEARSLEEGNPIVKAASAFAWAVSVVALLMGLVGVLNALLMSVSERVREIGVLSAIGWQPGRVIALIVTEGLLIASAGGVVGVTLGLLVLYAVAASPHVAGLIEPLVTVRLVIEVIVATMLLGTGGSVYPAWRATSMPPVEALKHE